MYTVIFEFKRIEYRYFLSFHSHIYIQHGNLNQYSFNKSNCLYFKKQILNQSEVHVRSAKPHFGISTLNF